MGLFHHQFRTQRGRLSSPLEYARKASIGFAPRTAHGDPGTENGTNPAINDLGSPDATGALEVWHCHLSPDIKDHEPDPFPDLSYFCASMKRQLNEISNA